MEYQIDLTNAIGQIFFNEEGDVTWHLEYPFVGPDRRYNTKYVMIFFSDAQLSIVNALKAFERFRRLVDQQKDEVYINQFVDNFFVSTSPSNYGISYYQPNHYNNLFPISSEENLKKYFNNIRTINSKALALSLEDCNKINYAAFIRLRKLSFFIDNNCNLGTDVFLSKYATELNEKEAQLKTQYRVEQNKTNVIKVSLLILIALIIILMYILK